MKIAAITMVAMLTGVAAQAAGRSATVCMESSGASATEAKARALASKMFAGIGVAIDWRLGLRGCPQAAILISASSTAPATLDPGALAYALPYEGAHICVFYNRIAAEHPPALVPTVLAHVLVHEITHVFEGIDRHSDSGVMKAQWGKKDYARMRWEPLPFTDLDVFLIREGLAARAAGGASRARSGLTSEAFRQ